MIMYIGPRFLVKIPVNMKLIWCDTLSQIHAVDRLSVNKLKCLYGTALEDKEMSTGHTNKWEEI